jgi:hypothetical protein
MAARYEREEGGALSVRIFQFELVPRYRMSVAINGVDVSQRHPALHEDLGVVAFKSGSPAAFHFWEMIVSEIWGSSFSQS